MRPEMLAPTAYLFGLGLFAAAVAYSEFLDRNATDDPFGDGANGNDPFIAPEHLKTLFHSKGDM
jgi:hypothetical protein